MFKSKLEAFVCIFTYVLKSITWFLFDRKASKLDLVDNLNVICHLIVSIYRLPRPRTEHQEKVTWTQTQAFFDTTKVGSPPPCKQALGHICKWYFEEINTTLRKVNTHERHPVWPTHHACELFYPVIGSHGQLFWPCWASSVWHIQDTGRVFSGTAVRDISTLELR